MRLFKSIVGLFKRKPSHPTTTPSKLSDSDVNDISEFIDQEVVRAIRKMSGTLQKSREQVRYLKRVIREICKDDTQRSEYCDTNLWMHVTNANPLIQKSGHLYTLHLGGSNARTVTLNKAEARAVCLGLLSMFSDIERDIRADVRSHAKAQLTHVASVAYKIKESEVTETHIDELAPTVQDLRRYSEEETVRIEK